MGIIPKGERREEIFEDLLKHERKLKRLQEEKKEVTAEVNGRIKEVAAKRDRCMDLLEGREVEQPGLPLGDSEVEREEEASGGRKPRVRGAGLTVALAEHGAHVKPAEVAAAQAELKRRAGGKKKGGTTAEAPTP